METKLEQFHQYLMGKISFYEDRTLDAPDSEKMECYGALYKALSNIEGEFARTFLQSSNSGTNNTTNKISLSEYRQSLLDSAEDACIERNELSLERPSFYHLGLEMAYTIAARRAESIDVNKSDSSE